MKTKPPRLRDYAMVKLINGATKAGIETDRKKEANKNSCRNHNEDDMEPVTVEEAELQAIVLQRLRVAGLKEALKVANEELDSMEEQVTFKLGIGAEVVGRLSAILETVVGKIAPKWKDLYLAHMAKEHQADLKKSEEAIRSITKPSTKQELVITEKFEEV
jgi:uncharacterized protein (UPF0179 family)